MTPGLGLWIVHPAVLCLCRPPLSVPEGFEVGTRRRHVTPRPCPNQRRPPTQKHTGRTWNPALCVLGISIPCLRGSAHSSSAFSITPPKPSAASCPGYKVRVGFVHGRGGGGRTPLSARGLGLSPEPKEISPALRAREHNSLVYLWF